MLGQELWDISDTKDDYKTKGLTAKLSINNCCNPWDCLCEQCCEKIESKDIECINYLFIKITNIDDNELVEKIKEYLKIIRNSVAPRDIVRYSTWLWRLLDNNKKILEEDAILRSVIINKLEEISRYDYKASQIIVELCRDRFSLYQ